MARLFTTQVRVVYCLPQLDLDFSIFQLLLHCLNSIVVLDGDAVKGSLIGWWYSYNPLTLHFNAFSV